MKPFGLKLCLSHSFLDDLIESDHKIIEIFYQMRDFMDLGVFMVSEIFRGSLDIIYVYSPWTGIWYSRNVRLILGFMRMV